MITIMRTSGTLFLLFLLCTPSFAADVDKECVDARTKYVPRATPEAVMNEQSEISHTGLMHCFDLPMYDEEWRKQSKDSKAIEHVKKNQKKWQKSEEDVWTSRHWTRRDKKYAAICFDRQSVGPFLLRDTPRGFIMDRTAIRDFIVYTPRSYSWSAKIDGNPYIPLLMKCYTMKRGHFADGTSVINRFDAPDDPPSSDSKRKSSRK